jgi:hypothetical protein
VPTLKKTKTSQIYNLMMHLKPPEKQEQTKPKPNQIRIRAKINEIKTKLYKESIKQKVGSLKRLTRSINP